MFIISITIMGGMGGKHHHAWIGKKLIMMAFHSISSIFGLDKFDFAKTVVSLQEAHCLQGSRCSQPNTKIAAPFCWETQMRGMIFSIPNHEMAFRLLEGQPIMNMACPFAQDRPNDRSGMPVVSADQ